MAEKPSSARRSRLRWRNRTAEPILEWTSQAETRQLQATQRVLSCLRTSVLSMPGSRRPPSLWISSFGLTLEASAFGTASARRSCLIRDFLARLWHCQTMDTEQKEAFLRNKIDWTDFGTVKRYVQSPVTEIDGAFVIDPSTSLAHVAAVAWSGDATRMTDL